jgi:Domain of unknown function (DUF4268)
VTQTKQPPANPGRFTKSFLALPKQQQVAIEEDMGCPLRWDELRREAWIAVLLDGADPEDRSDWPRQHDWLAKRLNDIHGTFASRVRALQLE